MEACAIKETAYVQKEIVLVVNAILITQRFMRTHCNPVPAID